MAVMMSVARCRLPYWYTGSASLSTHCPAGTGSSHWLHHWLRRYSSGAPDSAGDVLSTYLNFVMLLPVPSGNVRVAVTVPVQLRLLLVVY